MTTNDQPNATTMTDAMLMTRTGSGDTKAFETLVERHKKTAYRIALGLVGNRDEAMDISQEAFLRVHRAARSFDDSQAFFPWFYTIIANLCRSALRKRSVRNRRETDYDSAAYMVTSGDNPEATTLAGERTAALLAAIEQLSFNDRQIIMLQHFDNRSYDDIAEILDIPKGTVMSRLYYARKRLAELMRPYYAH